MVHLRRFGATLLSVLVLSALAAVPTSAQTTEATTTVTIPEAFVASASGRALGLDVLGTSLSIGTAGVLIDAVSGKSASADAQGAGVLIVAGTVANASVDGLDGSDTPPKACVLDLPLAGLLAASVACGEAAASVAGGLPQATASGSVAVIDLGLELLQPLLDQLLELAGSLITTVTSTLEGLLGSLLNPLLATLGLDPLTDTVSELIDGLQRATSVLTIEVGSSAASAVTSGEAVLAQAISEGATINLFPGLVLGTGAPLVSIAVGSAKAAVGLQRPDPSEGDPTTAVATPSFDPALVRVILGLPLLGSDQLEVPIGLGSPLTLLAGTPLESTISLGAGSTSTDPDTGAVTAVADGVSLQLLKGISGGIALELAHAEASAGGQSAAVKVTQVPKELPDTGPNEPWVPLTGAALLLLALGVRRSVLSPRRERQTI